MKKLSVPALLLSLLAVTVFAAGNKEQGAAPANLPPKIAAHSGPIKIAVIRNLGPTITPTSSSPAQRKRASRWASRWTRSSRTAKTRSSRTRDQVRTRTMTGSSCPTEGPLLHGPGEAARGEGKGRGPVFDTAFTEAIPGVTTTSQRTSPLPSCPWASS